MSETTHLALPYLAAAQAQKHVTHNEALARLDVLVQLAVADATLTVPPASPEEGDRHIVAPGATGAWSGHDGDIAAFVDGAWLFLAPHAGWIAFDAASESVLVHDGAGWTALAAYLGPLARLGVNTTADDTNRLALRSEAALFAAIDAADGGSGDIRLVASKAGEADTVSLVLQSGFSGRAEIGLAGDDDLVMKVSPDGAGWIEAIRIDGASGAPAVRYDNAMSGLAASTLHGAIDELANTSVAGPASAADGVPVVFDGASGKLVKATTFPSFKASLALAKADVGLGSVLNVPQRERLTASRTYYVRTDGSDGNDGLSNTGGGAFLTIQKAIDTAVALDLAIYSVTIQVGNGTYTQGLSLKSFVGGGTITLRGDPTTPGNVVINPTAAACITADNVVGNWIVRGVKLTATTSGNGIFAAGISNVLPYEIEFGSFGTNNYHMYATRGAVIYPQVAYTISGGAYAHMFADNGALIQNVNKTVTLSGTFAFSYFARAGRAGIVQASGLTFAGTYTVTGPRYLGQFNAIIEVGGGGASYFPGDSAGALATGAQYA